MFLNTFVQQREINDDEHISLAYDRCHFVGKNVDHKTKLTDVYKKFLHIRNIDTTCSPSDDIDSLWHQHILDTNAYVHYCTKMFNTIVHHDPEDSNDQDVRKIRLNHSINLFKQTFNLEPEYSIWGLFECIVCYELKYECEMSPKNCMCKYVSVCKTCTQQLNVNICPVCKSHHKTTYSLFIKTLIGKITVLHDCHDNLTINQLKLMIQNKDG